MRYYFIKLEGIATSAFIRILEGKYELMQVILESVQNKYGAIGTYFYGRQWPVAFAFPDGKERLSFNMDLEPMPDGTWLGRPNRDLPSGRGILKEMRRAVARKTDQELILSRYNAKRWSVERDSLSRTGYNMFSSEAWRLDECIIMRIPRRADDPFRFPAEAMEIGEQLFNFLVKAHDERTKHYRNIRVVPEATLALLEAARLESGCSDDGAGDADGSTDPE